MSTSTPGGDPETPPEQADQTEHPVTETPYDPATDPDAPAEAPAEEPEGEGEQAS